MVNAMRIPAQQPHQTKIKTTGLIPWDTGPIGATDLPRQGNCPKYPERNTDRDEDLTAA
jgi:hypothetical protein